jgi:hypothetical protein
MQELPDVMIGFIGANWERLGYCPVFLARLMEMGWSPSDIRAFMTKIIGPDFAEVNATEWINRLEEKGIECSDAKDEPPFRVVLDRLLFVYSISGKVMKGDFYIKKYFDAREEIEMAVRGIQ